MFALRKAKSTRIIKVNYSRNLWFSTETTKNEASVDESKPSEKIDDESSKLKQELASLKDLYLRNLAEMENLRHRTARELEKEKEFGIKKFAKEMLIVNDFLELSLKHENSTAEQLISGVKMTQKEFEKIMEKFGVVKYNPLGEKFDFNLHTAIFQQESKDKEPGTVCHVDKVGYMIKDKVLRSATVGVVKDTE